MDAHRQAGLSAERLSQLESWTAWTLSLDAELEERTGWALRLEKEWKKCANRFGSLQVIRFDRPRVTSSSV